MGNVVQGNALDDYICEYISYRVLIQVGNYSMVCLNYPSLFRFICVPVASTNGSPCHLYHHRANLQHITPTETQTHSPPPSFPKESFGMRCPFICDGKVIAHSTNHEGACSAPGSRSRSRPKPGDEWARARVLLEN